MMSEPRRLHPAAVIFSVIKIFKNLIYVIFAGVIAWFGNTTFMYIALGILGLTIILTGFSIVEWLRFRYYIKDDELRIEQGIFVRKHRYISKNRIQSIDLTQGVIHRILKLTKVQIETAGSGLETEASLSAVTFSEGEAIRRELKSNQSLVDEEQDESEAVEYPKRQISFNRLFVAGLTSGSVGVIVGLVFIGFSEIERFIPDSAYDQAMSWLLSSAVELLIFLALVVFILLYALGILGTVIKFGRFQITRYDTELFITRGLLEKKQMTIPLKRIQAIGFKQSLIRQPFGFGTLYVEIAGGADGQSANARTYLFPIIRYDELSQFLQTVLPEYEAFPEQVQAIPRKANFFYYIRAAFFPVVALIAILIFLPFVWYVPTILVLLAVGLGILRRQTAGYSWDDQQLTLAYRDFSKDMVMMKHNRIQAFEKRQSILHKRQGLATVRVSLLNHFAGRHVLLKEMAESEVDRLSDWYSLRK
ncbi:PH domain-containing protein [Alkalibacillus almallahensis]|uniref:PH domain-containing protein n=1 Tax=Alkalibacillus almallahensis TaxID=1379154 RepID=UPI001420962D|nr:PH domain-containing protein [Alkalibacillus almallahensis]